MSNTNSVATVFIDSFKDSDLASLGSWNQANNVLGYFTVSGSSKLEKRCKQSRVEFDAGIANKYACDNVK